MPNKLEYTQPAVQNNLSAGRLGELGYTLLRQPEDIARYSADLHDWVTPTDNSLMERFCSSNRPYDLKIFAPSADWNTVNFEFGLSQMSSIYIGDQRVGYLHADPDKTSAAVQMLNFAYQGLSGEQYAKYAQALDSTEVSDNFRRLIPPTYDGMNPNWNEISLFCMERLIVTTSGLNRQIDFLKGDFDIRKVFGDLQQPHLNTTRLDPSRFVMIETVSEEGLPRIGFAMSMTELDQSGGEVNKTRYTHFSVEPDPKLPESMFYHMLASDTVEVQTL